MQKHIKVPRQLTMGSLFDGIAGFPLASTYAQIRPVWSSEVEPFPIRVATKHFPDMIHFGDINAMNGATLPPVDIITGGFPCQSVSVAGRREGLKHISQGDEVTTRSGLFYEAVRIIKEMRNATDGKYPRFFVGENVPGIFSSGGGLDYKNVLEALCQIKDPAISIPRPPEGKWTPAGLILGEGFSLGWRVLDAAKGWGVAQRRRRVFIVVDFGGQCAGKKLFESEGCSGYTPPRGETRKGTAEYSAGSVGAPGGNQVIADSYQLPVENESFTRYILNDQGGGRMDITHEQTTTLRAKLGRHAPLITSGGFCMEHSAASRGIGYEEECSPTLRAGVVPGVALDFNPTDSRIGIKDENICPTICSRAGTGGNCTPLTLTAKGAYGISSDKSNAMLSDNPYSGIYEADTSRTLDTSCCAPGCNQGGIAVVESYVVQDGGTYAIQGNMIGREDKNGPQGSGINEEVSFTLSAADRHAVCAKQTVVFAQNQRQEVRDLGDKAGAVSAAPGVHQQTYIAQEKETSSNDPSYCMTTGGFQCVGTETAPTLEARQYKDAPVVGMPNSPMVANPSIAKEVKHDQPAICLDRACFNAGINAAYSPSIKEEVSAPIIAEGPPAVAEPQTEYLVRRLTPRECTLLQGYPRDYLDHLETEEPTDEEIRWWAGVFEEWNRIQGKKVITPGRNRIVKWLQNPFTDAAAYKSLGNSVAVPCVFFVMAGIAWAVRQDENASNVQAVQ